MNKKHYVLFIVKNISCVQFSSCHTSDKKIFSIEFFPNYGRSQHVYKSVWTPLTDFNVPLSASCGMGSAAKWMK